VRERDIVIYITFRVLCKLNLVLELT